MISCRDQCGAEVEDQPAAEQAGWSWLPLTATWRCGKCAGALYRASFIRGTDGVTLDHLPKDSRGALPKATVDTISPVAVR